MQCPACLTEMTEVQSSGARVDVCSAGCGGMWFDATEVDLFDDGKEPTPEYLSLGTPSQGTKPKQEIKHCPRCTGEVLIKLYYDVHNKVQMDQCFNCSGIFLDKGELQILKSQFPDNEAHKKGVEDYASKIVSEHVKGINERTAEWK